MTAPVDPNAAAPTAAPAPRAPTPATAEDRPVVLITGASSGIGHAVARRFAARGYRVFASMRRPEKGQALRDEAAERGWALHTPALDVTSDVSVAEAVAAIHAETDGRIDLLVNNAGYIFFGALEETTPEELRAQLETNVIGSHRLARAVLPAMRARRSGRIVFIGSLSGLIALPMLAPYHASKWAIEALAESLRYEVAAFGIKVVLIEPGPFQTALHDNEIRAAAAGAPDSPYADLLAAYVRESKKIRRAALPSLIDAVERASTVRRPRLRWPVGPSTIQAAYLRRLTPDWLYEFLVRLVFRIRAR